MGSWLPYAISGCSLLFAIYQWARNKTDSKEAGQNDIRMEVAKLCVKVDTVAASTEEMKSDIKAYNKNTVEYEHRLAACEASVAQAHKRINELRSERGHDEKEYYQ